MDLKDLPQLLVQGIEAQARGENAQARELLQRVLRLEPANAAALYSLAVVESREGRVQEALAARVSRQSLRVPDLHGTQHYLVAPLEMYDLPHSGRAAQGRSEQLHIQLLGG